MPAKPLTDAQCLEALQLDLEMSQYEIAEQLNISRGTVQHRLREGRARGLDLSEGVRGAIANAGITPGEAKGGWIVNVDPETGSRVSTRWEMPDGSHVELQDMVKEAITQSFEGRPKNMPERYETEGDSLLVIDLADVHFLKLCVKSETGYTYNREVAQHRVIEGVKALLKKAQGSDIGRILFVLGNDILHVDGPQNKTTSGTPQDTEGTIFQGFKDAYGALVEAIEICAETAVVDLIHCMSNHDWTVGWALSQAIAARFQHDTRVNSSEYSMSERHRKYYRFGNNLLSLDHGDGAKEEKLLALMVQEARQHIAECPHIYAYRHHVHHKIRARRGVDVFVSEKDHVGMTAIFTGATWAEGAHLNIEYVRSPSPPDGWHDRNAYVNRQGVECFVHHPHEGQNARFTEWF